MNETVIFYFNAKLAISLFSTYWNVQFVYKSDILNSIKPSSINYPFLIIISIANLSLSF
jgi:hypothetical protein